MGEAMTRDAGAVAGREGTGRLRPVEPLDLLGMEEEALVSLCGEMGGAAYRGRQLFSWLYARGEEDFSRMTSLPGSLRERLAGAARVGALDLDRRSRSADGTEKYAWRLRDGARVESVRVPMRSAAGARRWSLCVSTQAGCAMGCAFCLTARMGFARHLTAGEIVGQFLAARRLLPEGARFRNVVFMGMGEPLDNFDASAAAARILTHPAAGGVSPRRLTVSTVGVAPRLGDFAAAVPGAGLAVSLHAADDETRGRLVPLNRKWNLAAIIGACRKLPPGARRRVTFEYVLLRGVNDSERDAERLARLLRGLRCKVNLIPWNPFPGAPFERPEEGRVEAFRRKLSAAGVPATARAAKGGDISAACGQLADPLRLPADAGGPA